MRNPAPMPRRSCWLPLSISMIALVGGVVAWWRRQRPTRHLSASLRLTSTRLQDQRTTQLEASASWERLAYAVPGAVIDTAPTF